MSVKIIKDLVVDSSVVNKNFKLPVNDHTKLTPHNKGNFLYNITDNILYYATGTTWIPLISGAGNNLIAGPGISITAAGGNITITNTSPATSVTLSSLGGTFPLVPHSETGPALGIMGLNAGTGITLTSDSATEVTISASAVAPTLSSLDPSGPGNLIPGSPQTGPYTIRGISSPDGSITVSNTGTDVTLVVAASTPSLSLITNVFGPQGTSSFLIPAGAIAPRMWAAGGGGGGEGGNEIGVGGRGGCGAASTMQILHPLDTVQWTQIGGAGAAGTGGAIPTNGGNGGDTIAGVNNSPLAYLKGGQGGGNALINGSVYVASNFDPAQGGFVANTVPSYPPHFPLAGATFPSYLIGYNGGFPNALGGAVLANGSAGEGVILRAGGGVGGASTGGSGGGGGGGGSLNQGGAGGTGANSISPLNPSTPGAVGVNGSGGGGGGGGGVGVGFTPADGGAGGAGTIIVEYWLFTP